MDSLYSYLIIHEYSHQCNKVEGVSIERPLNLINQEITGQNDELLMDSLANNLRLNGIIIIVELQAFLYVAINLLLIAMVMLLIALLVGTLETVELKTETEKLKLVKTSY